MRLGKLSDTYAISYSISPRNGEEKEIRELLGGKVESVLALKVEELGKGNGLVTIITVS